MSAPAFALPTALEAHEPPEARGVPRDGVRLLVASRRAGTIEHRRFHELPQLLRAGDVLVVNVSATLPAALPAIAGDGTALRIHVATRAPRLSEAWRIVELRSDDGAHPASGRVGDRFALPGAATVELVAPYAAGTRLMLARFSGHGTVERYLDAHGEPIRYGYVDGRWPLAAYQNVYATTPGSAEMPSAGRPFTSRLITSLTTRGVLIAPVLLHCGVSSPERHEPPFPEQFEVPAATARAINAARRRGAAVIAVGTTVVRALETAASEDGAATASEGWTGLVIGAAREIRVVDGMITGWHEPEASHLELLQAMIATELLDACYGQALAHGYLWHEFGDSHLILP